MLSDNGNDDHVFLFINSVLKFHEKHWLFMKNPSHGVPKCSSKDLNECHMKLRLKWKAISWNTI